MNQTKTELRDPADLAGHYHPLLKTIPELAEDSPEFKVITDGIRRCGIIQPLLLDEENQILDDHSRTVLQCARSWQFKTVPVQVCSSQDAELFCLHSLAHRRHLTKSAIAYLAVPMLDKIVGKLAKTPENDKSPLSGLATAGDIANKLGISRSFLFEARKVRQEFEDPKVYQFSVDGGVEDGATRECTLKAWFEPRILRAPIGGEHESNRPLGLGGVIAGIASVREHRREIFSPKSANQLELFKTGFESFAGRALKVSAEVIRKNIRAWFDANEDKLSDEDMEKLGELGDVIKDRVRELRKGKDGK